MQQSTLERTGIAFRLQRRFERPRESVFRAWTDPEALKQWWCPEGWIPAEIEIDLRAGGCFRIGMRRQNGGAPVYVRGVFLEVSPPGKLAYTWKWESAFEQMPETRVTVEFTSVGNATTIWLTHEHLPEIGVCLQHRSGWMAAWDRIERII
jgi:uncharacterized protein YndB with AHSA1/START domain